MKRRAFVISLPILIDKSECYNLTSVPPKKMLHYPLRHSTYFTKTDSHIWTSELPVSTFIVSMGHWVVTEKLQHPRINSQ